MLYKGRVLNSGKIIDKSFKVYIPQLCAGLKETDQVFSENLKTDRILSKALVSSTIKYTAYIEAIIEILAYREQNTEIKDTHSAWEDFQENYIGHEDAFLDESTAEPNLDQQGCSSEREQPVSAHLL